MELVNPKTRKEKKGKLKNSNSKDKRNKDIQGKYTSKYIRLKENNIKRNVDL